MFMRIALVLLTFSISFSAYCQFNVDSILTVKKGLEYRCFADGYELTPENMKFVMRNNPESLQYLKKVQVTSIITFGISFFGGTLIGWPIGAVIYGDKPNWIIGIIGCGVVATTIPLIDSSNRNLKKAVDCYNRGVPSTEKPNIDVSIGLNSNGLGVLFRF